MKKIIFMILAVLISSNAWAITFCKRFPSDTPVQCYGPGDSGTTNWENVDLLTNSLTVGGSGTLGSSKVNVYGGGIAGELVNKGYELIIPNPAAINANTTEVSSLAEYKGNLYIGYDNSVNGGSYVYKWDGNTESLFYNIGKGFSFENVHGLTEYNGNLYVGNAGANIGNGQIFVYNPSLTPVNFIQMTGSANSATAVIVPNDSTNNAIFGSTSYSIEYYGRIDDIGGGGFEYIVNKFNSSNNTGFNLRLNTGSTIVSTIVEGGTQKSSTTSTTLTLGGYHDIISSWTSGSHPIIYIDGVLATLASSTNSTTPTNDTANSIYFGNNIAGTREFGGTFRRVRIWRNYAVTSGDASSLASGGSAGTSPTGEYLFTEGSGTTVADTSGNNNTGTVISPAFWNNNLFDIAYAPGADQLMYSLGVFKGKLYAGAGFNNSRIYVFDGTTWSTAYAGLGASPAGLVNAIYTYKGNIFAGIGNGGLHGGIVSSPEGSIWTQELNNITIFRIIEFKGRLYATTEGISPGAIYVRNDSTATWSQVTTFQNSNQCDGLAVYNSALYVGCTVTGGGTIYKSFDGLNFLLDFTIPYAAGGGSVPTEPFSTINYNGSLYIGVGFSGTNKADIWRKTDSGGQLSDNINFFINKFRGNINRNINWNEDLSSLNISPPTNFDSLVGFSKNGINWDNISNINTNNINWNNVTGDSIGRVLTRTSTGVNWSDIPSGGGSGTVTSVSVTTANGFSGSVATATTTPAITLTAGAITPSSVNGVVISGSSTPTLAVTGTTTVSGINTGDQTNISGNAATVTTNANLTGPITSSGNATSIATQTGTGTKFVVDTSPILVTPNIGVATGTSLALTSTSATSLAVGPNGTTTPLFNVDSSTSSAVAGISVKGAVTGGTVTISATDSGSNTGLTIQSKGTGNLTLTTPGSATTIFTNNGATDLVLASSRMTLTPSARSSGSTANFSWTGGADTALTTLTDVQEVIFNNAQTKTHANGAITTLRHTLFQAPTDAFTSSASIITDDATMAITGGPDASTNATITNSHGLLIQSRAIAGTVTNAYGLTVNAPSGSGTINATYNFIGSSASIAERMLANGHIETTGITPTIANNACGATTQGTVVGKSTDISGSFTVGTLAVTSCVVTFNSAWTNAPNCVVTDDSNIIAVKANPSTTTLTVSSVSSMSSDVISYICYGNY